MPLDQAVSRWTASPQTHTGTTGDGGGENESFGLVTAVVIGMDSSYLPVRQDERNYDALVDRRTASPEQGGLVLGSLPGLRKNQTRQSMCNSFRRSTVVFSSRAGG